MEDENVEKFYGEFGGQFVPPAVLEALNQLEEAFNSIGASMMSTEFAAKLLAWTLKYGGGNEAVTMHGGLNAGIRIAQQKFNLFGGETPTLEGVQAFNKYHNENGFGESI